MGCGGSKNQRNERPRRRDNGRDPNISGRDDGDIKSAKIIIMGNQKVGKTSVIKAFMERQEQKGVAYVGTNTV